MPKQTDSAGRIVRGGYLANGIARCFWCHSPLDSSDPVVPIPATLGSGNVLFNAPNITPDPETGLGRWTNWEIVRAIREGIGREGRELQVHPSNYYSVMTDEDATAIVSYLRSLQPIRRMVVPSARSQRQHEPVQSRVPPAQTGSLLSPIQRGGYLVQLGECVGCHTPAKADGSPARELTFAGGRRFRVEKGDAVEFSFDPTFLSAAAVDAAAASETGPIVASANLTQDPSGIPHYTEVIFIQTIRTGKVAGVRPLTAAMPWVFFRTMTDADLRDVFAYLRSVRAVQHRVNNSDPPTWCPRCGRRHGLGEFNTPWPVRRN
jgi:mono/diheme cytochrome c family protein